MLRNKLLWAFFLLILTPNILLWLPIVVESWETNQYNASVNFVSGDWYQLLILVPIVGSIVMLTYSIIYKNYRAIALSIVLFLAVILEIFFTMAWAVSQIMF